MDEIRFTTPGPIHPREQLPPITAPLRIIGAKDGNPPGAELTGRSAVGTTPPAGLIIRAPGVRVQGMIINGFPGPGVFCTGSKATLVANYIGTNRDGTAAVPNRGGGLVLNNSSGSVIGGTKPRGNVISGNGDYGITCTGGKGTQILGNLIGTDVSGKKAIPNRGGVSLYLAESSKVGGAANTRNILSGNTRLGLYCERGVGNVISYNYIGTDVSGTLRVSNGEEGLSLNHSVGDTVNNNVISGNNASRNGICGLAVVNEARDSKIFANLVGTDFTGRIPIPNERAGILVGRATNILIGGSSKKQRNVIAGNSGDGIRIDKYIGVPPAEATVIQGNYIGLDIDGKRAIPNATDGIRADSASGTIIGGPESGHKNIVAGNGRHGIRFEGSVGTGGTVDGNVIGLDASGIRPMGNGGCGVSVELSRGEIAPRLLDITRNIIAYNRGGGVFVVSGKRARITGNSIYNNIGLGIDLGADGVTPNEPTSPSDPNNGQKYPTISEVSSANGRTFIRGELTGVPGEYTIEVFTVAVADESGYGEGDRHVLTTTITLDPSGRRSFETSWGGTLSGGTGVAATATDGAGNTSEFSVTYGACRVDVHPGRFDPPFRSVTITSDYGPRDYLPSPYHKGIDYRADVGTPVAAIEGGTIEKIDYQDKNGWFVRIRGTYTQEVWAYLHLFNNAKAPISSGRFKLGRTSSGRLYIARYEGTNHSVTPQLVFVKPDGKPNPIIEGVRACSAVNRMELFAASGDSYRRSPDRTVDPHLHVGYSGDDGNALVKIGYKFEPHTITIKEPNAGARLTGETPVRVVFEVNSRPSLDLDKVRVYLTRLDEPRTQFELTPSKDGSRAAWVYGGKIGEPESPSAKGVNTGGDQFSETGEVALSARKAKLTFSLLAKTADPGLEEFVVARLRPADLALGRYELTIVSIRVSGEVAGTGVVAFEVH